MRRPPLAMVLTILACAGLDLRASGAPPESEPRAIRGAETQLGAWESSREPVMLTRDQMLALVAILKRGEDPSSFSALRVLARAPGPLPVESLPVLIDATKDSRFYVRRDAVTALVAAGAPAVEPLQKLLASDSARQRAAAVAALSQLGRFDIPQLRSPIWS